MQMIILFDDAADDVILDHSILVQLFTFIKEQIVKANPSFRPHVGLGDYR